MKKPILITLNLLIMFALVSCDILSDKSPLTFSTKHTNTNTNTDAIKEASDTVYDSLQKDIFTASCVGCHNAESALKRGRLDFTNKLIISENSKEILDRMLIDPTTQKGAMPPRGDRVEPALIDRFSEWHADPVFANIKVNIFEASCVRCHNPNNARRLDFTNRENIIEYFDEAFYRMGTAFEDNNRPMPPVGRGERVPKQYVDLYETWFNTLSE